SAAAHSNKALVYSHLPLRTIVSPPDERHVPVRFLSNPPICTPQHANGLYETERDLLRKLRRIRSAEGSARSAEISRRHLAQSERRMMRGVSLLRYCSLFPSLPLDCS